MYAILLFMLADLNSFSWYETLWSKQYKFNIKLQYSIFSLNAPYGS